MMEFADCSSLSFTTVRRAFPMRYGWGHRSLLVTFVSSQFRPIAERYSLHACNQAGENVRRLILRWGDFAALGFVTVSRAFAQRWAVTGVNSPSTQSSPVSVTWMNC